MACATILTSCRWLNEPAAWTLEGRSLTLVTAGSTDFWRGTYYGFERDSGHLFATEVAGDFSAEVTVLAGLRSLYDQAGLMARIDETRWIKAGLELSDGHALAGSVLTLGTSDWGTGRYWADPRRVRVRITRVGGALWVQVSPGSGDWTLIRLCAFPASVPTLVGPYACTPERAGLEVRFEDFEVGPPKSADIHAPV